MDQNGQSRWEGGANRILDLQAPSEPGRTLILMHHNVPGSTHVIFEPDAPNRESTWMMDAVRALHLCGTQRTHTPVHRVSLACGALLLLPFTQVHSCP